MFRREEAGLPGWQGVDGASVFGLSDVRVVSGVYILGCAWLAVDRGGLAASDCVSVDVVASGIVRVSCLCFGPSLYR